MAKVASASCEHRKLDEDWKGVPKKAPSDHRNSFTCKIIRNIHTMPEDKEGNPQSL